jgi:putative phosphoribosyl transferase
MIEEEWNMTETRYYRDRFDAGKRLARLLGAYAHRQDVLVLALPRGGVPVAFEVAKALSAPLDVFMVRKLGVPGHEELAMGAIATGGTCVLNEDVISWLRIPSQVIDQVREKEQEELLRRERLYRDDRPVPEISGRIIMLIDDGLATGASMRVAAIALRQRDPARLVIAVPVAPPSTCLELQSEVDDIVCALTPDPFFGVGWWYENFSQTSDQEVHDLLDQATREKYLAQ